MALQTNIKKKKITKARSADFYTGYATAKQLTGKCSLSMLNKTIKCLFTLFIFFLENFPFAKKLPRTFEDHDFCSRAD